MWRRSIIDRACYNTIIHYIADKIRVAFVATIPDTLIIRIGEITTTFNNILRQI